MPYQGNGIFVRSYNWVNDANANIPITASRMDGDSDGFATGLSTVICSDGQSTLTGNIPFSGFKITGYGTSQMPSARSDVPALSNIQDGLVNWIVATGSSDALTASYAPILTALVDGQLCFVRAASANTTTTPTFSPNTLPAHPITKLGGTAVVANEWVQYQEIILRYNLANTRWEILNPGQIPIANVTGASPVPTGAILDFGGTSAPTGYLACDGTSYLRTDQPTLFTAIGTTWGSADGTHFNVPNFQRRATVGSGGSGTATLGNAVGNTGGQETHTLLQAELPSYNLTVTDAGHTHNILLTNASAQTSTRVGTGDPAGIAAGTAVTVSATTGITVASAGSGTAFNEYFPVGVVLKIIKT